MSQSSVETMFLPLSFPSNILMVIVQFLYSDEAVTLKGKYRKYWMAHLHSVLWVCEPLNSIWKCVVRLTKRTCNQIIMNELTYHIIETLIIWTVKTFNCYHWMELFYNSDIILVSRGMCLLVLATQAIMLSAKENINVIKLVSQTCYKL